MVKWWKDEGWQNGSHVGYLMTDEKGAEYPAFFWPAALR